MSDDREVIAKKIVSLENLADVLGNDDIGNALACLCAEWRERQKPAKPSPQGGIEVDYSIKPTYSSTRKPRSAEIICTFPGMEDLRLRVTAITEDHWRVAVQDRQVVAKVSV